MAKTRYQSLVADILSDTNLKLTARSIRTRPDIRIDQGIFQEPVYLCITILLILLITTRSMIILRQITGEFTFSSQEQELFCLLWALSSTRNSRRKAAAAKSSCLKKARSRKRHHLSFCLNMREAVSPNRRAAATPPEAAVRPPVNIPRKPSEQMAFFIP